ncbi:MAG: DUF3617 domain-containing protein [Burkholderiaceae bacterium]|nr:DUF3617 domain-containing protein [Burkholderiaceae bacterium]
MRSHHALTVFRMPVLAALAAASLVAPAMAQPKSMKPGLWEMSMRNDQVDAAMARLQEQMKNMPPAQRQMMQQMMSSRGVDIGGRSVKVCITPEQARRGPRAPQQREDCKQNITWSGRVGKFEMQCKDGTTGRGEMNFASDTGYSGWMSISGPQHPGKPMRTEMRGQWLSADCQGIKPAR